MSETKETMSDHKEVSREGILESSLGLGETSRVIVQFVRQGLGWYDTL